MSETFEGTLNTVGEPVLDSSPSEDSHTETPDGIGGTSAGTINTDTDDNDQENGDQAASDTAEGNEGKTTDGQTTDQEKSSENDASDDDKSTDDSNTRFDKHPRFQELLKQQKEQKALIEDLQKKLAEAEPKRDFDAELEALAGQLEEGDIDLKEYNAQVKSLAQEQADAERAAKDAEEQQQREIQVAQEGFLKEFPFISELLKDSPDEIEALKAANPIHDDATAAMALHIQQLEASKEAEIKEAVEKAVQEAQKKFEKNLAAKQSAKSLGSGPAANPEPNNELKNTATAGGVRNVLAKRLASMRSGS